VPDAGQGVNTMVDSKVVVNCASDKLANAPRCGPVIVTGNLATARCGVFDVVSRRELSTVTTCVYPHRLRSVDKPSLSEVGRAFGGVTWAAATRTSSRTR